MKLPWTDLIAKSVAALEDPHPKGPVSLPQVSRLRKNLILKDPLVCLKCHNSPRTLSQGTSQSAPNAQLTKNLIPRDPSVQHQVLRLTKNLIPRDLSVSLLLVLTLTKKALSPGTCLSQRDMCDSSQSHFFCQELLSIEHDNATCYL